MNSHPVTISIPNEDLAFVEEQLALGRYDNAEEVFRAGIAALRREAFASEKRAPEGFEEADGTTAYDLDDAEELRGTIAASLASGTSARRIPGIMNDVKAKLRANGTL